MKKEVITRSMRRCAIAWLICFALLCGALAAFVAIIEHIIKPSLNPMGKPPYNSIQNMAAPHEMDDIADTSKVNAGYALNVASSDCVLYTGKDDSTNARSSLKKISDMDMIVTHVLIDKSGSIIQEGVVAGVESGSCAESSECYKKMISLVNVDKQFTDEQRNQIADAVDQYKNNFRIRIDNCVIDKEYCYLKAITAFNGEEELFTMQFNPDIPTTGVLHEGEDLWIHNESSDLEFWRANPKMREAQEKIVNYAKENVQKAGVEGKTSKTSIFKVEEYAYASNAGIYRYSLSYCDISGVVWSVILHNLLTALIPGIIIGGIVSFVRERNRY